MSVTLSNEEAAALVAYFGGQLDNIHLIAEAAATPPSVANVVDRIVRRCKKAAASPVEGIED